MIARLHHQLRPPVAGQLVRAGDERRPLRGQGRTPDRLEQRLPVRLHAVGRRPLSRRRSPSRSASRRAVMDKLIERELLAGDGREAGLRRHRRRGRRPDRRRQDRHAGRRVRPGPDAAEGRGVQLRVVQELRAQSSSSRRPTQFLEEQKKELLASRVRNLVRVQRHRLAGRGEGRLRPQEPPGQPRVHALHQPRARRPRSRSTDAEIAAYAAQERGEAEGDLRAEEVPLREGARRSGGSGRSWSRCPTTPTRRPTRRRARRRTRWPKSSSAARRAPARTR